jgi:type VI secretion system protein ImpF
MAWVPASEAVVLSILSRLQDDEPTLARDTPKTYNEALAELKQAIRLDLERLLNSRRRVTTWPAQLRELARSLVNYGLPDLAGLNASNAESREELRRTLETVIRTFEPRLSNVRVHLLENAESLDRTLRFRIEALVRIEPVAEPVAYDSTVVPVVGSFQIRGVKA